MDERSICVDAPTANTYYFYMDQITQRKRILRVVIILTALLAGGCASHSTKDAVTVSSLPNNSPALLPDEVIYHADDAVDVPSEVSVSALVENASTNAVVGDHTNLWQRIRAAYALLPLDSPLIAKHERWFSNNPEYMERMMGRAKLYLYYIVEEVEKRGMPMEIALLPAIESAYKPHAYSRARAVGLWQFIPSTGRHYGLKANWWYDGRRDVMASTNAALDYLEKLNKDFEGDWHLALAAYNAGEGRIMRARRYNQARGLPTDFVHLKKIKRETRNYVPKLIAMANIVADPDKYGLRLAEIPNEPYFARVDVGSQIGLDVVARLADVPIGDLYDINPGFKRWATDPNGPHHLLVPAEKKEALIVGLSNLSKSDRIQWRRHRIRRGDTLSTIARRYGVGIRSIKTANNLRGNTIRAGHNLMIPISSRKLSSQYANLTKPAPRRYKTTYTRKGKVKIVHRVRRGETLYSIAKKYRVYIKQITQWNLIHKRDILRLGQRLKIWVPARRAPSVSLAPSAPIHS